MAKFSNLSKDVRFITHGLAGLRAVKPGDVVEVADEAAQAYASQPALWRPACDAAKAAAAAVERDLFGALEKVAEVVHLRATPAATNEPAAPATITPAAPATITPAAPADAPSEDGK